MYIYPDMNIELNGFVIDILPLVIGILVIFLIVLWRRKHSISYLLCCFIFGIYLIFAVAQVFFPITINGNYADTMRQEPFTSFINLNPLYFGPFGVTLADSLQTFLLNIILTIPFGFGVNFIAQIKAKNILWLALGIGVGVELMQLLISVLLGYAYRFIDINDVLMNGLGILIGYSIFRVCAWLYVWVRRRLGIQLGGLAGYIHTIASRA